MANANDMVRLLEDALLKGVGVNQITVDGQTVTYASRQQMISELDYWRRRAALAAGRRSIFRGTDLGSAW